MGLRDMDILGFYDNVTVYPSTYKNHVIVLTNKKCPRERMEAYSDFL